MMRNNKIVTNMADEVSQQTSIVNTGMPPTESAARLDGYSDTLTSKAAKDVISTDILQQALNEADGYDQSNFSHVQNSVLKDNIQHLNDHSYIHSTNSDSIVSSSDVVNTQNIDSIDSIVMNTDVARKDLQTVSLNRNNTVPDLNVSQVHQPQPPPYSEESNKICLSNDMQLLSCIGNSSSVEVFADTTAVSSNSQINSENTVCSDSSLIESSIKNTLSSQYVLKVKEAVLPPSTSILSSSSSSSSSSSFDITQLKLPVKQTTAPLGSVENPIQIIQNGDKYHSTQVLTPAQLQQITHVLQRQHARKVIQNGGKSVLYDPSTNTRIVCRVVHPSELQNKKSNAETNAKPVVHGHNSSRGRGRPRKSLNKRIDDDEKGNPALSKEEREEKKKHRPRTRSGRISKPPSYMVKDYKRIHHLDFNEEPYDDSDGGYSDYHVSDDESGSRSNKTNSLPPGVSTAKQRNYSCASCSKAYIGRGGLSRHYRLNPSHGSMPEGEDVSTQDENSNSSLASSILSSSGGNTNNQNNTNFNPHPVTRVEVEGSSSLQQQLSLNNNNLLSDRRKSRLKEILKSYSDKELLETLLSKFSQDVSLWDFFVAKCGKKTDSLSIFEMLKEFEKFVVKMRKVCLNCLSPANLDENQGKTIINISSKQIAGALLLDTGAYVVKDSMNASSDSKLAEKCFTNVAANSTTELELPVDVISPLVKRKRMDPNVEDVSEGLPEQILSDVVHEGDSLELPLPENFSGTSDLRRQEALSTSLSRADVHTDITSKALFDLSSSTTVTPSSLSSGCLSAINSSKNQSINSTFLTTSGTQHMQNIQVKKVHLFGSQQQQLLSNDDPALSVSSFSMSTDLPDFSTQSQIINKDPPMALRQIEICDNPERASKHAFQGISLDTNIDIFNSCQELQTQTVIMNNTQTSAHSVPAVSMINSNIHNGTIPNDSQNVALETAVSRSIVSCLPVSEVIGSLQNSSSIVTDNGIPSEVNINTAAVEEPRELEVTTHNEIPEATKPLESSTVLRHLMLPDGQVIGLWSQIGDSEKTLSEQHIQGYLPGNLIILQNPNGSVQVPNDQAVPLETLQTLVTVDPGSVSQTGTHTYTTVQHM